MDERECRCRRPAFHYESGEEHRCARCGGKEPISPEMQAAIDKTRDAIFDAVDKARALAKPMPLDTVEGE